MNGITVKELLCSARSTLSQLDTARLDTEVLLASVMNSDRETLFAYPETKLNDELINRFLSLISKRVSQVPIAYLTGYKEFWSMNLMVNCHTLIPRPETEILVQTALDLIPDNNTKYILDMGTGSGAIAIAIAKEKPSCHIIASDISNEAIVVAKTNAAQQQLSNITFIQSDLFSKLDNDIFDLILCNPPYVESHDIAFQCCPSRTRSTGRGTAAGSTSRTSRVWTRSSPSSTRTGARPISSSCSSTTGSSGWTT